MQWFQIKSVKKTVESVTHDFLNILDYQHIVNKVYIFSCQYNNNILLIVGDEEKAKFSYIELLFCPQIPGKMRKSNWNF